jgi:hypothetical protein
VPDWGQSADSTRSERQRGADTSAQALGSGGAFLRRTGWAEMSIECLTPVADGVNRGWEVDYLRQGVGDR